VFVVLNTICISVFLNRFVIFMVCGPVYVKEAHLFDWEVVV
jgi:hypothetical protein